MTTISESLNVDETIIRLNERFAPDYHWDIADEYGEPGYGSSATTAVVLGYYWCRCDQKDVIQPDGRKLGLHDISWHVPNIWKALEDVGVEFEWHDEWYASYENYPMKAYRTKADSYQWQPSIQWNEDICDYMTPDDDIDVWLEWASDDPSQRVIPRTVWSTGDLEAAGFTLYGERFENGWHPGQTDDPADIVKAIRVDPDTADHDIVFHLSEASQFYIGFAAYTRPAD